MAQNKNIFINIEVSNSKAKQVLDATSQSVDNLSKAKRQHTSDQEKLNIALSDEGKRKALTAEYTKRANAVNREYAKATVDSLNGIKKLTDAETYAIKQSKKLADAKIKLKYELSAEAKELAKVTNAIRVQQLANKNLTSSNNALSSSVSKTTKNLGKGRAQSGLNNAILIETGRVASDAAYGMQGIANNLGRLIELGQEFSRTGQGGFFGAFKQLGKSLMGAGGLIVGVQLLLSFAPRIIAFFTDGSMAAKKFREELEKVRGELRGQRKELMGYIDVLEAQRVSEEVRLNALKELEVVIPSLTEKNKSQKLSTDELRVSVEEYIKQQALRAELDALISNNTELFADREKVISIQRKLEAAEDQKERESILLKNQGLLQRLGTFGNQVSNAISTALSAEGYQEIDLVEMFKRQNKGVLGEYDQVTTRIAEIQRRLTLPPDDKNSGKDSAEFQTKIFEAKYTDFEKIEQKYRERSQKSELRTNQEILAQTQQNEMAKIDILEQAFVRKQQLRLADYKDQLAQDVKSKNITQEEADVLSADADAEYLKSVADAAEKRKSLEVEVLNFISSLRTLQDRKDANIAERDNDKRLEVLRKFRLDSADILKLGFGDEEDYYTAREDAIGKDIEQQKRVVDAYEEGSLLKAQAQVELFNLEDNLRQNSLQKEIAAINEKKRVNMAYVSYAMGVGQIMAQLAGENEALQKAALVIEKGAAIGSIVVDAHSSIAQSRANTAVANTAAMALPIPFSTIKIAKNEAMFAKEALMTKISAGIGIASILATTISSFKKPSVGTGGGGGGGDVQAPAFNVVGTSSTDQLAQAVSSQSEMPPIKAYVVGKEITHQQELDRNIVNTAGVG